MIDYEQHDESAGWLFANHAEAASWNACNCLVRSSPLAAGGEFFLKPSIQKGGASMVGQRTSKMGATCFEAPRTA